MRKAAIYLRVSTQDQTTANQERELRAVAERMGIAIAKVYRDHGISGAKGRDKRPDFDRLCKHAGIPPVPHHWRLRGPSRNRSNASGPEPPKTRELSAAR
jgi:hypothetical protein